MRLHLVLSKQEIFQNKYLKASAQLKYVPILFVYNCPQLIAIYEKFL